MSSRIFVSPDNLAWKKAYLAAVLEGDCMRVPLLAQRAKETMFQRMHELWMDDMIPCDELEAIHDALCMLDALLSTLSYRDDTGLRLQSNWEN